MCCSAREKQPGTSDPLSARPWRSGAEPGRGVAGTTWPVPCVQPAVKTTMPIRRRITEQGEICILKLMLARAKKPVIFLASIRDPVSVLFLLGTFDTIVCFFQPERFCYRAGRADAAFLLEYAGRRLPRNAEKQALIGPHAFIICRARPADA